VFDMHEHIRFTVFRRVGKIGPCGSIRRPMTCPLMPYLQGRELINDLHLQQASLDVIPARFSG